MGFQLKSFAVLAALLPACCGARSWSRSDIVLEATFAAATLVDGLQSRSIVAECREANPVIGECGDRLPLAIYIPLSALLHAAITGAIPHGTGRTVWLGVSAGAELDTVYSNQFTALGH